jgi:hypothetical protein
MHARHRRLAGLRRLALPEVLLGSYAPTPKIIRP